MRFELYLTNFQAAQRTDASAARTGKDGAGLDAGEARGRRSRQRGWGRRVRARPHGPGHARHRPRRPGRVRQLTDWEQPSLGMILSPLMM